MRENKLSTLLTLSAHNGLTTFRDWTFDKQSERCSRSGEGMDKSSEIRKKKTVHNTNNSPILFVKTTPEIKFLIDSVCMIIGP